TAAEVAIVTAIAMLFSSFSSPFLTAIFTVMLFLVGRSADTLSNLPARLFGPIGGMVRTGGIVMSKIVPNLNVYVPTRPILLGQVPTMSLPSYLLGAWANALLYAVVLLVVSAIVFR